MFNSAIWNAGEGSRIDDTEQWILPAPVSACRAYDLLSELPRGLSTALGRECAITRLLMLRFDKSTLEFKPRDYELTEEVVGGILHFVDRYGLFGELHQNAIEIHGYQNGWKRENGRWLPIQHSGDPSATFGTSFFRQKSRHCRLESLEEDYFPSGFPKGELPSPDSKDFLAIPYAEKIENWWHTAALLGEAFFNDDRKFLESWLSVAGFGLTDQPAPLDYESHFPSLISALVAQYVNARRDGLRIHICGNQTCPRARVFFGLERARFCSPHCGNAQYQRERRNRTLKEVLSRKGRNV